MTTKPEKAKADPREARPSLLPFDPADLVALRVCPAQFARMVGVSKQTVSRWVQSGKVTLGPDGRLDPAKASREVIERTHPGRLRARVFKQATATHAELRQRIKELEAEQAHSTACENAARYRAEDEAGRALARFMDALAADFDAATEAHRDGHLDEWLDELAAVEVYGMTLAEYRADVEPGNGPECPG